MKVCLEFLRRVAMKISNRPHPGVGGIPVTSHKVRTA